ncbi:MAG: 6-phosphofructokinase, partial [Pyrinomonadaceae bacterium]
MKTIGIATGGGDAPGLNAVIRAAVKTAVGEYGLRVIGIEDSFEGLLGETHVRELKASDVRGLLPRG